MGRERECTSSDGPVKHFHASHSIHSDLSFSTSDIFGCNRFKASPAFDIYNFSSAAPPSPPRIIAFGITAGKGKHDSF